MKNEGLSDQGKTEPQEDHEFKVFFQRFSREDKSIGT